MKKSPFPTAAVLTFAAYHKTHSLDSTEAMKTSSTASRINLGSYTL